MPFDLSEVIRHAVIGLFFGGCFVVAAKVVNRWHRPDGRSLLSRDTGRPD